ncbi:hypothetical protein [Halomonas sp. DP8Y7-1]|uniref:hypothetical protein n=1 Tax=Halomonas sp. DP8Y7-1 TaxID=2859078 RepID=UPI003965606F
MIEVEREELIRTLIAKGVGVGLLHGDAAHAALTAGEVGRIAPTGLSLRQVFALLHRRASEPLLHAARDSLRPASTHA